MADYSSSIDFTGGSRNNANPQVYTDQEMLETTQKNSAKRPNRFWAKKLAERHLI